MVLRVALPKDDPQYIMKIRFLGGRETSATREFQIPANYKEKKTRELFSFMRFVYAKGPELVMLPPDGVFVRVLLCMCIVYVYSVCVCCVYIVCVYCMYVGMYVCMYVCMLCVCVCMVVCMCVYVCMYVCVCCVRKDGKT